MKKILVILGLSLVSFTGTAFGKNFAQSVNKIRCSGQHRTGFGELTVTYQKGSPAILEVNFINGHEASLTFEIALVELKPSELLIGGMRNDGSNEGVLITIPYTDGKPRIYKTLNGYTRDEIDDHYDLEGSLGCLVN